MRHTEYITYSDVLAYFIGLGFTILVLASLVANAAYFIH